MPDAPARRPPKAVPRAGARRSEAQRAQLAAEEERRRQERLADAQAEHRADEAIRRTQRGEASDRGRDDRGGGRGRGRGGMRGGFMGQQNSARPALPPVASQRRADPRLDQMRSQGRIEVEQIRPGEAGSSASAYEDRAKLEDSGGADASKSTSRSETSASSRSRFAAEGRNNFLTFSEEEYDEKGIDVDRLNDTYHEADDDGMGDVDIEASSVPHQRPIRLDRRRHVDRQIGLNTAKSAATSNDEAADSRAQTYEEQFEKDLSEEKLKILYKEFNARLSLRPDEMHIDEDGGERAFLVQLPPTMPELIPKASQVKQDKASSASPERRRDESTIKPDVEAAPEASDAPSNGRRLRFPAGKVGTMRLYEDGRREMKWGDVDMTVKVGHDVGFLQSLVMTGPAVDESQGIATAFGAVRDKLVLTLNLDKVLPSRGHEKV